MGINRNIVECKVMSAVTCVAVFSVLIETLWNVKYNVSVSRYSFRLVLIETLWNVKIENYDRMEDWTGINRNIVECKGIYPAMRLT